MEDKLVFPIQHDKRIPTYHGEAPTPCPWEPKLLSEQWVYTDGSNITG